MIKKKKKKTYVSILTLFHNLVLTAHTIVNMQDIHFAFEVIYDIN